jgi:serine/threonine protein kinase
MTCPAIPVLLLSFFPVVYHCVSNRVFVLDDNVVYRSVLFLVDYAASSGRLIDFGTSIEISTKTGQHVPGNRGTEARGVVSSLHFAPPEVLSGKGRRYASKVDSWQLGAVLYTMLFGDLPFVKCDNGSDGDFSERESVGQVILAFSKMHHQERYEYLFATERTRSITISDDAKDLIMNFLCPNPRMRVSLFDALTSPFLI